MEFEELDRFEATIATKKRMFLLLVRKFGTDHHFEIIRDLFPEWRIWLDCVWRRFLDFCELLDSIYAPLLTMDQAQFGKYLNERLPKKISSFVFGTRRKKHLSVKAFLLDPVVFNDVKESRRLEDILFADRSSWAFEMHDNQ
jgi:hypothetical protein